MTDFESRVGDEFERAVEHRFHWEWIVIAFGIAYFVAAFIPWMTMGFPVAR